MVCPQVAKFGYDLSQGYSPMGGGLTSQIVKHSIGDNVPGHDIIPFLKVLQIVYMDKKI